MLTTNQKVYLIADSVGDISDWCWSHIKDFDTKIWYLGDQLIRALDSMGANLVEGFGQEYDKCCRQFWRYSKGSALESVWWMERAMSRGFLPREQASEQISILKVCIKDLEELLAGLPEEDVKGRKR